MKQIAKINERRSCRYSEALPLLVKHDIKFKQIPKANCYYCQLGKGTINGVEVEIEVEQGWNHSLMKLYSDPKKAYILEQTDLGKLMDFQ